MNLSPSCLTLVNIEAQVMKIMTHNCFSRESQRRIFDNKNQPGRHTSYTSQNKRLGLILPGAMLLLGQASGTPPWWVARWCSPLGKVLPLGQEKVLPLGGWAGAPPWAGRREVRQILRYRHCPTLGAPTLQLGPILGLAPIKICYFSDASQKDKKKSPIRSGIFFYRNPN